jgi:DNA polymerase IV
MGTVSNQLNWGLSLFMRKIIHLDMDAFYASVEQRDDPALRGRPVAVGGSPQGRGVVAACSYEARKFGVRSAMPMARALRLCPDAVVRPPDFATYQRVSARLRELFLSVTPLVEPLSLDEAFLDVGGSVRLFGPPPRIAAQLRARIRDELALPASVGVAPNKFLAKLCSEKAKPGATGARAWGAASGLVHLPAGDVQAFLAPLGVRDLWGVGAQTAERLERFGVRTVADVAAAPRATLVRIVGQAGAAHLAGLAAGRDPRPVIPWEPPKGMSAEETFEADVDDPEVLRRELLRLSEKVARRLRAADYAARTVTLKLRYASFSTVTRSRTVELAIDQATELHREVCALLDALGLERVRVRLVGVGTSNLVPAGAARQMRLLDPRNPAAPGGGEERWGLAERAADRARRRFGESAVTRGALLDLDPRPGAEADAASTTPPERH